MGAAGLTCSAVEMGAKGDLGIELDLNKVPVREARMTPYEMMLSESQERMLMVLRPEKHEEAEAIFVKWGLDFAVVGKTTDDLRFRILFDGKEVANLPIKELGDEAPEYDRPWVEPKPAAPVSASDVAEPKDYGAALLQIMGSPDIASRRWVFEQYDTLIQGNSMQRPGGDAGVVRVDGHPTKALAFSSDVTPRYCEADPYQGGAQAVAECWRNLTAVGAEPLAATDNLNFGNPEKPEIMGQLVKAIQGIGAACEALGFPIVSGNVSLYNETLGQAILPTPTIGGVGLIDDRTKTATIGGWKEGDVLFLVGQDGTHLGSSIFLREIAGREDGGAPVVDLGAERRHGDAVRSLICSGRVSACHDLSDGGLAVALAEMAIASNIGAKVSVGEGARHGLLFGEDQARYVVAVAAEAAEAVARELGALPHRRLGTVGGTSLEVEGILSVAVSDLTVAHESWFPNFMSGTLPAEAAAA
jgi:phosphoribosylformylglycinamidine synthase